MTNHAARAALCALLCAVPRAQECLTNLVPNGDFEAVQQDPWQVVPAAAAAAFHGLASVDGALRSRCIELRTNGTARFALAQPAAFPMVGGRVYEVRVDLEGGSCCFDVEVGLTAAGGTRAVAAAERVGLERRRISARFVAPDSADRTVDLAIVPTGPGYLRVDDVVVRPVGMLFTFAGPRIAGTRVDYRVEGPAGVGFAVLLGVDGVFEQPWPVLPCDGGLWLRLPVEPVFVGSLGAAGIARGSIAVPASVRGARSYWQPLTLVFPCTMGCPQLFVFN